MNKLLKTLLLAVIIASLGTACKKVEEASADNAAAAKAAAIEFKDRTVDAAKDAANATAEAAKETAIETAKATDEAAEEFKNAAKEKVQDIKAKASD
ncbi:MAG: hypothetical protein H0W85_08380 [Methylotenera sp.]|nr:hypothetical protein [Methylotenera sp.]